VSFYNILTSVAAVGGQFLPTMAGHFTTLLDKFDRFVQHARADGSLKQWVQNGITAIDALGRVVGNIGSILGALFQAGQTAGANFLAPWRSSRANSRRSCIPRRARRICRRSWAAPRTPPRCWCRC